MSDLFGIKSPVSFAVLTRPQLDDVIEGRVTLGCVKVYLALYAAADFRTWECFPGFTRLQRDAGVSRDTVSKAVGCLEARVWIKKTKGGRTKSNRYFLPHPLAWISGRSPSQVELTTPSQVEQTRGSQVERTVTKTHLNKEHSYGVEGEPSKVSLSTKDWEECQAFWPGRQTPEARGRFFQNKDWTWDGKQQLKERLEHTVECHRMLGWALPNLAYVLDPANGRLTTPYLEGLANDAQSASKVRGAR